MAAFRRLPDPILSRSMLPFPSQRLRVVQAGMVKTRHRFPQVFRGERNEFRNDLNDSIGTFPLEGERSMQLWESWSLAVFLPFSVLALLVLDFMNSKRQRDKSVHQSEKIAPWCSVSSPDFLRRHQRVCACWSFTHNFVEWSVRTRNSYSRRSTPVRSMQLWRLVIALPFY